MVGYFRKQNILFIILGAVLGLLAAWLMDRGVVSLVLFAVIGALAGRFVSGIRANRQVDEWNNILFRRGEPEKFMEVFTPILERTAESSLERVDGHNKMAYAWEALGEFDKAWDHLNGLNPEMLSDRYMDGLVTTYSNRTRVQLLRENVEGAETALENLRMASELAMGKNRKLGHAGRHYVRLYENWLLILKEEPADEEFLEEEIKLSSNRIRNSELQLVLAKSYEDMGDAVMAEELRMDAMTTGMGLWAEKKARELLRGN